MTRQDKHDRYGREPAVPFATLGQNAKSEAWAWFARTPALPSREGGGAAKPPAVPAGRGAALAGAVAKFFSAAATAPIWPSKSLSSERDERRGALKGSADAMASACVSDFLR